MANLVGGGHQPNADVEESVNKSLNLLERCRGVVATEQA